MPSEERKTSRNVHEVVGELALLLDALYVVGGWLSRMTNHRVPAIDLSAEHGGTATGRPRLADVMATLTNAELATFDVARDVTTALDALTHIARRQPGESMLAPRAPPRRPRKRQAKKSLDNS